VKRVGWLIVCLGSAQLALGADPLQRLHRSNEAGNRAFRAGDYEAALERYKQAEQLAPGDPRIAYNQANSLAQHGDLEGATRLWNSVLDRSQGTLRRDALYNRGLSRLLQQKWDGAVRDFVGALEIDPADLDARRNLELALKQLQQQQQQQKPQNQEQQQKPQNQPQGQQPQPSQTPEQQPQGGSDSKPRQQPESGQPPTPDPQQGAAQPRDNAQQPAPGSADQGDASSDFGQQLLESLRQDEMEALKRALKQGKSDSQRKRKNW
jgi:hypothetical protein